MRDERAKQIIDVWKTVVTVQQHFNDIEMRIRGLFVTILLALFASIGFLLDKKLAFSVGKLTVQFYVIIPLIGAFGTYLFYFIDRHWYHRLLLGSVLHGIEIEKRYKKLLPELSLSEAIGERSPVVPTGLTWVLARLFVTEERFKTNGRIHTDGKIEIFYKSVAAMLLIAFALLIVLGGVSWGKVNNQPLDIELFRW